jgi:hypothetical protein
MKLTFERHPKGFKVGWRSTKYEKTKRDLKLLSQEAYSLLIKYPGLEDVTYESFNRVVMAKKAMSDSGKAYITSWIYDALYDFLFKCNVLYNATIETDFIMSVMTHEEKDVTLRAKVLSIIGSILLFISIIIFSFSEPEGISNLSIFLIGAVFGRISWFVYYSVFNRHSRVILISSDTFLFTAAVLIGRGLFYYFYM